MFLDAIENISDSTIKSAKKSADEKPASVAKPKTDLSFEIDLHGYTVAQAENFLAKRFAEFSKLYSGEKIKAKIITGKGLHSGPGGSALSTSAHTFVRKLLGAKIISISESPAQLKINNLPIRGHFDLIFKA